MTQTALALTIGAPVITYTKVEAYRKALWEERGFELLQALRQELEDFNSGQDQTDALLTLSKINYLITEISTIDPRWLNYSVTVFMVLLDYNHLKKSVQAKKLLRKFGETLEVLYGRSTNSESD